MKTILTGVSVLILAATSYAQSSRPTSQPAVSLDAKWSEGLARPVAAAGSRGAIYGRTPQLNQIIPLASLYQRAESSPSGTPMKMTCRTRGVTTSICPKKGCWMRIREGRHDLFVRFVDYSFFMPRNLIGYEVELEGELSKDVVSQEERRHYAEDAGKSPQEIEAIVGDRVELRLLATSVTLKEPTPRRHVTHEIGTIDPTLVPQTTLKAGQRVALEGELVRLRGKKTHQLLIKVDDKIIQVPLPTSIELDQSQSYRCLAVGTLATSGGSQGWRLIPEGVRVTETPNPSLSF